MSLAVLLAAVAAEISPERLEKVCGDDPSTACRSVLDWTDNQLLASVADKVVEPIVTVVVIWTVAILVNRVVRRLIKRIGRHIEGATESDRFARMKARTPKVLAETGSVSIRAAARAKTTTGVLRSVSSFVVYTVAVGYTFSALGLRLGPLVAGAGVVGVALGFGAQSMVKDFLGGMFMLVEDQFGVGDVVDISDNIDGKPGVIGTVEAVTLRTTSVRDVNGTIWHIPNGDIRRVGNMSQGWARAVLDVAVPYGADLDAAKQVIDEVAQRVMAEPKFRSEALGPPEVWGVQDVGPDAVVIRLVIKTRPGEQWPIMRALRAELHDALVAGGFVRSPTTYGIRLLEGDPGSDPESPAVAVATDVVGARGVGRHGAGPGGVPRRAHDTDRITSLDDLGPPEDPAAGG